MSKLQNYMEEFIPLRPGDVLAVYTDGVTETANPAGEEYGVGAGRATSGTLIVATEEISVQFAVYQKVDMKARGSYTIIPPPNSTQPMAAQ